MNRRGRMQHVEGGAGKKMWKATWSRVLQMTAKFQNPYCAVGVTRRAKKLARVAALLTGGRREREQWWRSISYCVLTVGAAEGARLHERGEVRLTRMQSCTILREAGTIGIEADTELLSKCTNKGKNCKYGATPALWKRRQARLHATETENKSTEQPLQIALARTLWKSPSALAKARPGGAFGLRKPGGVNPLHRAFGYSDPVGAI
eukprot:6179904-Pleurochrysis_carterae.AAC.3